MATLDNRPAVAAPTGATGPAATADAAPPQAPQAPQASAPAAAPQASAPADTVDVNAVNIFLSRSLRVAKSLDRQLDQLKEQRDEYEKKKTNLRIKVASIISAFTKNLFEQRVRYKQDTVNKINGMITFLQKEASLNKEDQLSTDDLRLVADNMTNLVKSTSNNGSNTLELTDVTDNKKPPRVLPSSSELVCNFNKKNLLKNIGSSCYLDSVLFALFARKVPYLEENIVNVDAKDIKSDIENCQDKVNPILDELKKIVTRLRSTTPNESEFYCTDLRKQMEGCDELNNFAKREMQSSSEFLTKLLQFLSVYGEISKTEKTFISNFVPRKEDTSNPKLSESNGRIITFDEKEISLPFQTQYDSNENDREYTFNKNTATENKRTDVTLKTRVSYPLSAFVFFVVERQILTQLPDNKSINPTYKKLSSTPPEELEVTYNLDMKTITDKLRQTTSNTDKPALINNKRSNDKQVKLELYAVVVHNNWHYTCYLKCPNGTWIYYDDIGPRIEQIGTYSALLDENTHPNILTNGTLFFYKLPDSFLPENKAVPATAEKAAAAAAKVKAAAAAEKAAPSAAELNKKSQTAESITNIYNEKRKGNFPYVYGLVYANNNLFLDYKKIIELVDKNKEIPSDKINISYTNSTSDDKNNYATLLSREALIIYNENLDEYRKNKYNEGGGNGMLRPYRIDSCSVTGRKDALSTLGVLVASAGTMLNNVDNKNIPKNNILDYEIETGYTVKNMIDNTFDNIMLGLILNPHLKYVIYSSDKDGLIGIAIFKNAFDTKDKKNTALYMNQVQTYIAYKFFLLTNKDPNKWGYISNGNVNLQNNDTAITVDGPGIDKLPIFGKKYEPIKSLTSSGTKTPIRTFQTDRSKKDIVLTQIC